MFYLWRSWCFNPFDSLSSSVASYHYVCNTFMLQVSKQPESAQWATSHIKMKSKTVATFLIPPTDYFLFVVVVFCFSSWCLWLMMPSHPGRMNSCWCLTQWALTCRVKETLLASLSRLLQMQAWRSHTSLHNWTAFLPSALPAEAFPSSLL